MHRFLLASLFVSFLAALLPAAPSRAAKAYITDTQEVVLRATPGNNGKAILTIPPGSAVEPMHPNAWTHVRFTKPEGGNRDGWVPSKYMGAWPPASAATKELEAEAATIKEQLSTATMEKEALSLKEADLADKLTKLNSAYEELKSGSSNFLRLKAEHEAAKASLASAQENIQGLIQENENLKLSQRIQWFAAGALVLLFGWFLGWITGRRQKKKRAAYFY